MSQGSGYLSVREAAAALGVRPQTLYAYVSRGLIRSEATGGRARRYHAEDVAALRHRKQRDPAQAAQTALSFGAPVLDSAITLILDDQLYYRGQDTCLLAREASIRTVAALLWRCGDDLRPRQPSGAGRALRHRAARRRWVGADRAVPGAAADCPAADARALDLAVPAVAATGARILRLLTAAVAEAEPSPRPVDAVLAEAWGLSAQARPLLRAALILCADHELNVSAFAAHRVASAQASPYNAVAAGIAALQGARHGGASERVDAFLGEALAAPDPEALAAGYLRRGDRLPGFGHHLYRGEDPRARLLLDLMREQQAPLADARRRAAAAITGLIGRLPNIDFALALLRCSLALPPGAALTLFAIAAAWAGSPRRRSNTSPTARSGRALAMSDRRSRR